VSGTVRILAIALGAAIAALLYFGWGVTWYIAGAAGLVVLIALPICHEFVVGWRRDTRLKHIQQDAQDRKDTS
jgi:fatty acid desaturase